MRFFIIVFIWLNETRLFKNLIHTLFYKQNNLSRDVACRSTKNLITLLVNI